MFTAILILFLSVYYGVAYPSQTGTPIQTNASIKLVDDLLEDDATLATTRAFVVNKEDKELEDSNTCSTPTKSQQRRVFNRNHSPILDDDQLLQESFRQQEENLKESRNRRKHPLHNPTQTNLGVPIPPPFPIQNLQSELLDIDEEEKLSELLDIIDNLDDWNSFSELTPSDFVFGLDIPDQEQFKSYLKYSDYIVTRDNSNSINGLLTFKRGNSNKDPLSIRFCCYKKDKNILQTLHNKLEELASQSGCKTITVIPVDSSLNNFYHLRHYQNNGEFGVLAKQL